MVSTTLKSAGLINYSPDELLFEDIQKTFKMKKFQPGHILSIYLAIHGLRQGVYIVSRAAKKDITNFINRYKGIYNINYRIYSAATTFKGMYRFFLSTTQKIPDDLVGVNDKLNHQAIGEFLGYPCPRDLNKSYSTHQKFTAFSINIKLNNTKLKLGAKKTLKHNKHDNNSIPIYQIYGFICPSNDINTDNIRKELSMFCAKVNKYCQPRFKNLLPGLQAYYRIMNE